MDYFSWKSGQVALNSAKYLFDQVFYYNQIIPIYFISNDVLGQVQVDPAFGDWACIGFNIWLNGIRRRSAVFFKLFI